MAKNTQSQDSSRMKYDASMIYASIFADQLDILDNEWTITYGGEYGNHCRIRALGFSHLSNRVMQSVIAIHMKINTRLTHFYFANTACIEYQPEAL